ncbi:MAG: HIT domain-containing protein [Candidatus Marsarchaeota archaeon]|jgi:diadenosine tetraphosphate (Ap4A) HIT family hydrolase|nr:HIT domain-containing protein [Candidatus Marsarchaeota archaeon]
MNDDEQTCVFCKIIRGDLPSYKIYENEKFIALLDIYPNIDGETLVIPKKHTSSYAFDMSDHELKEFVEVTKKVAKQIESNMPVARVHLVLEGTLINHLHAKLYPAKGYGLEGTPVSSDERVYFEKYPGYVSTLLGPKASDEKLRELQRRLSGNRERSKV